MYRQAVSTSLSNNSIKPGLTLSCASLLWAVQARKCTEVHTHLHRPCVKCVLVLVPLLCACVCLLW